MATTFLQLQTEFLARGYQFLSTGAGLTRAKNWINQSYLELCEEESWPFLLSTATPAAPPLAVGVALGEIMSVFDTSVAPSRLLESVCEDDLRSWGLNLSTTGPPIYYYLDNTAILVYPVGGIISARFYLVPTALSSDADVVVVPDRFVDAIISGAVRRAALDTHDAETAQSAEEERQRTLVLMRRRLLNRDGLLNRWSSTYGSVDG